MNTHFKNTCPRCRKIQVCHDYECVKKETKNICVTCWETAKNEKRKLEIKIETPKAYVDLKTRLEQIKSGN